MLNRDVRGRFMAESRFSSWVPRKRLLIGTQKWSILLSMRAVTIREAKAHLNALVDAAERGEQVILMRGSKHVAAIVPVSAEDLELVPSLTDAQAERLWRRLEEERRAGRTLVVASADQAQALLQTGRAATSGRSRRGPRPGKRANPTRHR